MRVEPARGARQANAVVVRYPSAQRAWSRLHARLYRLTGGRFLPRWFGGAPVLVLETVGRRTRKRRSSPVLYLRESEALIVLAANAGADRTPAWWLNLWAAGEATARVGGRRVRVVPRVLEGVEREQRWEAFVAMYPQAAHYVDFTDRPLPLVALEPG